MILISLLYFILANAFLVLITKKKFGLTIPFTMMLSTIVVYISGILFKNFTSGIILDILIIPITIIYLICNRNKKKLINEFKKNYFSKGLLITVVVGVFFFIYDFRRIFIIWDELSHWGIMVKNLLNLNNFYSELNSTLMPHRDYPPMISLYEMLCVKFSGFNYNESIVASALHMFNFLLFLPAMSEIKISKKLNTIVYTFFTIIAYLLLILYFDSNGIMYTIYIDYTVALLCSLGLIYIFITKQFNKLSNNILFTILLIFLILSKDVGIPLYAVLLFSVTLHIVMNRKEYNWKDVIKILVLFVVIPLLFLLSWRLYIKQFNITPEFDLKEVDVDLLKTFIFSSKEEGVKYYYNYTRTTNLTSGIIQMTYLSGSVIGAIILYILYNYYKLDKKKTKNIFVSLIVCHVGYYLMFLTLITLAIRHNNGPFKGSLIRYLDTYMIIQYGLLLMLFIYSNLKKNKNVIFSTLIVIGVLLSIQNVNRFNDIYPAYRRMNNHYSTYGSYADVLKGQVSNGSKVFFLTMEGNVGQQYFIQYYADQIKLNDLYFSYDSFDYTIENNYDSFINYLKEFDYFYLINKNDEFVKKYSKYFDELKDNATYKIEVKDNTFKFFENK